MTEAWRKRIDATLQHAVESGRIPGVCAIVARQGRTEYAGAFGLGTSNPPTPVTGTSIFRIASMTKPVTSVAVMQLAEAGKVRLDEAAQLHLPDLAAIQVLGPEDRLTAPTRPVTIRQLLANTSGFGYERWNQRLLDYRARAIAEGMNPAVIQDPLLFEPGTQWMYGPGTAWLGRLVEAVSGQTLAEYCRKHIFEPLGMTDTGYDVEPQNQPRLVSMQQRSVDGTSLREIPPEPLAPVKVYRGDGGLYSTAADYMKFLQMIETGGAGIIRPGTVDAMAEDQLGGLPMPDFQSLKPKQSLDGQVPGGLGQFGLGFAITSNPGPGGRSLGSLAWAGLHNTYFWVDRAAGVSAVILMQILPFLDRGAVATLRDFEAAVYS